MQETLENKKVGNNKSAKAPEPPQQAPWQFLVLMFVIAAAVLLMVGKVMGIF